MMSVERGDMGRFTEVRGRCGVGRDGVEMSVDPLALIDYMFLINLR